MESVKSMGKKDEERHIEIERERNCKRERKEDAQRELNIYKNLFKKTVKV